MVFSTTNLSKPTALATTRSASGGGRTSSKPFYCCDYCDKDGHSESRCFRKNEYPEGFKEHAGCSRLKAASADKTKQTSPLPFAASIIDPKPVTATFTPAQIQHLLSLISSVNNPLASMAGISIPSSALWIIDSDATHHIVCAEALLTQIDYCAPMPLISLPDGCSCSVTRDRTSKMILTTARRHGNLYVFDATTATAFASVTSPGEHFNLWHWLLRHPAG